MAQTSFAIDENTSEALDRLKKVYGVSSNAAVLKRALAIALLASRYSDDDSNIHVLDATNDLNKEIILPQKF